jgi:hypothetical protein
MNETGSNPKSEGRKKLETGNPKKTTTMNTNKKTNKDSRELVTRFLLRLAGKPDFLLSWFG